MTALQTLKAGARAAVKHAAGSIAHRMLPQCAFDQAIFLFGHMRCGSTAVSNVLCSHPQVSGYGEAHIAYDSPAALGRLAINQQRRKAWKPGARHLFDKILHSRYDAAADPGLDSAHGIFLIRAPHETILSIRTLFARIGSADYANDEAAATYYEARLAQLARLWPRFAPERRIGASYAGLTAAPEPFLARLSALIGLDPPLTNHYERSEQSQRPGAGDPLSSHRFNAIVAPERSSTLGRDRRELDLPSGQAERLEDLYRSVEQLISAA